MGTFGQYQEIASGPTLDGGIHLHEGLDIPKAANSSVKAVMAGTVEAIFRDTQRSPYDNFIVIRDSQGNLGWNYKHVVPLAALRVGDEVAEGQEIGKVAEAPASSVAHVHLDRGEAPAMLADGEYRDSTIPDTSVYRGYTEDLRTSLLLLTTKGLPAEVYNNAALAAATDLRVLEALRWQYITSINPLTEFTVIYPDVLAPTIDTIAFRLGSDDELGNKGGGGDTAELRRSTAHYFNGTVVVNSVGSQPLTRLGRNATVVAANGDDIGGAEYLIDFVVNAYDRFAIAGQTSETKLNPNKFDFTAAGRKWGASSGIIQSFDFTGFPNYEGIGDFIHRENTRSAYENDQDHNSSLTGPFWYIITNTPDATRIGPPPPGGPAPGAIFADNRELRWNSLAPAGHAFSSQEFADDNAHAEYPDDIYDITVGVSDLQGLRTTKTVTVVLSNWDRTVVTDKGVYGNNEAVTITTATNIARIRQ
ncbi:MAG: M23 family metallopeptidase [Planctomycetia bacterium]|nr:M23 family metallopeptidase [Planctomycetia bacterium]